MILEAHRHLAYNASESRLFFWRTNTGAEVDLLVEKHGRLTGAFEFKSTKEVGGDDFSGLRAFRSDNQDTPLTLVYCGLNPYETDGIRVIPWEMFLENYCLTI